jgi:hypothetical protein
MSLGLLITRPERAALAVLAEVHDAAVESFVFHPGHRYQKMMREVHRGRIGSHMPPILLAVDKTYPKGLMWFRRDLRVDDNAALYRALRACRQVVCVFVFDKRSSTCCPVPTGAWSSSANRWWSSKPSCGAGRRAHRAACVRRGAGDSGAGP